MDRPALRLIAALLGLLGAASLVWMFQGLGGGNRAFILQLRGTKLAGLVVVGAATGIATVLFQTAAANRVLTPSIMGFDALYVLLQTGLVAALGVAGFAALPAAPTFLAEVAAMSLLAAGLFGTLLGQGARDIPRMILTGVILGVMFRALSGFLARIMDPNAFATTGRMLFGERLWPWVDPDNVSRTGTTEPGPGRDTLDEILRRLERL